MEPLASLGQVLPPAQAPRVRDAADRTTDTVGARAEARPVELSETRVDETAKSEVGTGTRDDATSKPQVEKSPFEESPAPGSGKSAASSLAPPATPDFRDLEVSVDPVQYTVVDSETREVVSEVPTDAQIEFSKVFEAFIGTQVDIYA